MRALLVLVVSFALAAPAEAGLFSRLFSRRSCSSCSSCSKPAAQPKACYKTPDGKWVCPKK